jgi:elongation factor P hydroxylase
LSARRLEQLFAACFAREERTLLVGGAAEPLYVPARSVSDWHRIHYREDYVASALHEVAHWCIAGRARRALVDYGYWYSPDGRDASSQCAFERVEARPQALEWLFAEACGYPFRLSLDNLQSSPGEAGRRRFAAAVAAAATSLLESGPPPRARRFLAALRTAYPRGRDPAALRPNADDLAAA